MIREQLVKIKSLLFLFEYFLNDRFSRGRIGRRFFLHTDEEPINNNNNNINFIERYLFPPVWLQLHFIFFNYYMQYRGNEMAIEKNNNYESNDNGDYFPWYAYIYIFIDCNVMITVSEFR